MPYAIISDLPEYVQKYTSTIQRMFLHVFNSTYAKVLADTESQRHAEQRAFRAANSTIKKRTEQNNAEKYGHDTHFRIKVDKFLGNLPG